MIDITKLTIKDLHALYTAGSVTVAEVVNAYKSNIIEKNGEINAYVEIFNDLDTQVENAQRMINDKEATFLTGVPLSIKDNMLFSGHGASAGSLMLKDYIASYSSPVVEELVNQGAIMLGRTNMDEFAMGSSTETSYFGITKNPIDTARVPGGSSGGAAASVAMDGALVSLGSDTGGSIRQPAAFCNLVGLKPTYGTVSRYGLMAMASSLDQIGPIAKNVDDAEMLYNAIARYDTNDATSVPLEKRESKKAPYGKKIGIPRNFIKDGVQSEVMDAFNKTIDSLKSLGYEIIDIDLPLAPMSLAVYYVIQPAEVSSNMARYDGLRFGYHDKTEDKNLLDTYLKNRSTGLGMEVRRRCILGAYILSHGYYDAYYKKATDMRVAIRNEINKALEKVDFIVTPTTPTLPFLIGERSESPLEMYLADLFNAPANITGSPAISVPVYSDKTNLPIGIQAITHHFNEENLFTFGRDVEQINKK
jgi:aspartyl-tRNA(Asn)/glutamyl-tRNA(Gln) amidotransferase subunit A